MEDKWDWFKGNGNYEEEVNAKRGKDSQIDGWAIRLYVLTERNIYIDRWTDRWRE